MMLFGFLFLLGAFSFLRREVRAEGPDEAEGVAEEAEHGAPKGGLEGHQDGGVAIFRGPLKAGLGDVDVVEVHVQLQTLAVLLHRQHRLLVLFRHAHIAVGVPKVDLRTTSAFSRERTNERTERTNEFFTSQAEEGRKEGTHSFRRSFWHDATRKTERHISLRTSERATEAWSPLDAEADVLGRMLVGERDDAVHEFALVVLEEFPHLLRRRDVVQDPLHVLLGAVGDDRRHDGQSEVGRLVILLLLLRAGGLLFRRPLRRHRP
mmetsp:Transcript_34197/g.109811  ORF Transcript_34197/g.109811 Transcript_34197/m.109811 type:complete len:264 (-) Transcript_34197:94-885(-)